MSEIPGGAIATRPLHFFFLCDCSGSMAEGGKIQALNQAIKEVIPNMRTEADSNPNAQVMVRVLKFSSGAQWHIAQPTPIDSFIWQDLSAGGVTDMGKALKMLANQLKMPPMEQRALPPVIVLISDGQPTDDFSIGLKELLSEPWGKKAVRVAIAIGNDANQSVLSKFIDNPEIPPLLANNPEALVRHIKWASTATIKQASTPKLDNADVSPNVPVPLDHNQGSDISISADDVW